MNRLGMLLVMLAYASSCYSEDTVTGEDALRGYQDYFESIRSISLHSRFMDRNAEKSDHFTNTLSQKWRIDFEGRRLWRTTQKIIEDPKTEAEKRLASTYFEALVTPDAHYGISAYVDTRTAYSVLSYLETPQDYWRADTGLGYLCYPLGYLKDGREYQYIPDMVREASKSVLSGEGEPSSLVVVAAKTAEYEFEISLDPAKAWFAERIEFRRTAPPEDAARPSYCLYTVEHSTNHGGVSLPDLYHCEISKEAGKHKLSGDLRMVDGALVIVTGDSEIGTDFIEKPKSALIAEVTLSDIELGPLSDSDFQLETTIPNGMEVSMQDARRLSFVWRDGEVVSLADELEALRDSEFLGGPGSPRFWAVALGVILVGLILYFVIRDRRKARSP